MKKELEERIVNHGKQLMAIFPQARPHGPSKTAVSIVSLCKQLRRLEVKAQAIGLQLCNGPEMSEGEQDKRVEAILDRVDKLLGFRAAKVPVFVNLDPRGYALKIGPEYTREHNLQLHHDWGGYGIIAPDLREGE
jgi:hypothetical protein